MVQPLGTALRAGASYAFSRGTMAYHDSSQVLWRYHQWRCEYSPRTPQQGVFRLYDKDVRVIEAVCSRETATGDFSQSCRALVETAENTRESV